MVVVHQQIKSGEFSENSGRVLVKYYLLRYQIKPNFYWGRL